MLASPIEPDERRVPVERIYPQPTRFTLTVVLEEVQTSCSGHRSSFASCLRKSRDDIIHSKFNRDI
jgi:hypothetical protein